MKPPFHVRGPFMAKLWLLIALTVIGVQMVFVVNLLSSNKDEVLIGEVADNAPAVQPPLAEKDYRPNAVITEEANSVVINNDPEHIQHHEPRLPAPLSQNGLNNNLLGSLGQMLGGGGGLNLGESSQLFNFLQQSVMDQFTKELDNPDADLIERPKGPSQMSQLAPLLSMLPILLGTSAKNGGAEIRWEKYMPLLERMERFAAHCTYSFKKTIIGLRKKYPEKAKQPSFSSAVAMKGFFRIFAEEGQQEEFLEMADEAYDLLDAVGLTDHAIDLMSGRLYDNMLTGNEPGSAGSFDLASILLPPVKKAISISTTTMAATNIDGDDEGDEEEQEEENNSNFVSNEHFESIMEMYDAMFRDDEASNQTVAKMELNGRTFLQNWYESLRRFAREKGKLHAKSFSPAEFDKYMESIEVPYSNILDFYYPIRNEQLCSSSSLDLIIIIVSQTEHLPLRNAIRQTWLKDLPKNVRYLFLLTDRDEDRDVVKTESEKYTDVVTVDVPQTTEYVSRKALVALDWPSKYCASAKYIFKTTDQSYVNVTFLLDELGPLVGNLVEKEPVGRVPLRRNFLFYDEYPYDIYPNFLKDFGFIMGMDFAKNGVVAAKDFPLIRTDDFSITGILAAKLKISPENFKRHAVARLVDMESSQKSADLICRNKDSVVFAGRMTASEMLFIQSTLNTCPAG